MVVYVGPFQKSCYCRANSTDRIKFDFSTAVARRLKPSRDTAYCRVARQGLPCYTAIGRLICFHSRSIFWKTLLFSLPSLLYFLSFVLILSSGHCNVYISEQLLYQVKGFVLCRMSTTLALWFAEILTMYTIMLVIRFRTSVLFKVMLSFGIKHVL